MAATIKTDDGWTVATAIHAGLHPMWGVVKQKHQRWISLTLGTNLVGVAQYPIPRRVWTEIGMAPY